MNSYGIITLAHPTDFLDLAILKKEYKQSNYLDIVHNIEIRNIITRLRLDMNKLKNCQGRYNNIPVEERKCPSCNTSVETVRHFLIDCPLYREERINLITTLNTYEKHVNINKSDRLFDLLLNVQPLTKVPDDRNKCINAVCQYIKNTYAKR